MTVRSSEWHRNVALAQLCAYLLIIAVAVLAFRDSNAQQDDICSAAAENREATRNLVIAIYTLGAQLVIQDGDDKPPTPGQQRALDQFAEFRDTQLALLADVPCE